MTCAVLVPQGKIALGKLAQALVHGAQAAAGRRQLRRLPRRWPASSPSDYPVALVNSVNPVPHRGPEDRGVRDRRRARRRARTSTACRSATPATSPPTGRATASTPPTASPTRRPRMLGFQAAGAAPIVRGEPVHAARDHRHRDPDRQPGLLEAGRSPRATSPAACIDAVTDDEILAAYRLLAAQEGVFVEPASAASVAGLLQVGRATGVLDAGPDASSARSPATASRTRTGRSPARRSRSPCAVDAARRRAELGLALTRLSGRADVPGRDRVRVRVPRPAPTSARASTRSASRSASTTRSWSGVGEAGLDVEVAGEGADKVPRDERTWSSRAMQRRVRPHRRPAARACDVRCPTGIPHGRGLGSSAAAIVGGLAAARALTVGGDERCSTTTRCSRWPPRSRATRTTSRRPCSAAFTIAWTDGRPTPASLPSPSAPDVAAGGVRPAGPGVDHRGRARLLPDDGAARATPRFNAGRAALLVAALIADRPDLLLAATEDRLHQDVPRRGDAAARSRWSTGCGRPGVPRSSSRRRPDGAGARPTAARRRAGRRAAPAAGWRGRPARGRPRGRADPAVSTG